MSSIFCVIPIYIWRLWNFISLIFITVPNVNKINIWKYQWQWTIYTENLDQRNGEYKPRQRMAEPYKTTSSYSIWLNQTRSNHPIVTQTPADTSPPPRAARSAGFMPVAQAEACAKSVSGTWATVLATTALSHSISFDLIPCLSLIDVLPSTSIW